MQRKKFEFGEKPRFSLFKKNSTTSLYKMESLRGPMQKFALALFQACRKEHPTGNFLYSPVTASTGLLVLLLGADGKTRWEIESAMKLNESPLFGSSTFEEDLQMAYRFEYII